MNAVILSAILSAGNSGMYASTRMLYNLALEGQGTAPVLPRLAQRRATQRAVRHYPGRRPVLPHFGLRRQHRLHMAAEHLGHVRLHRLAGHRHLPLSLPQGYLAQGGRLEDLPYRAKLFPFGPLFAFALCMVITLGQNYQALVGERIDWIGLLATYISLPLFLAIWLGYRWKKRARFVRYHEMDVSPTNT